MLFRMRTRMLLPCLTALALVIGCGDDTNKNSGSSGTAGTAGTGGTGGDGGSAGNGGAGGGGLQIEKPENAIDGQYIFFLDDMVVMPDQVQAIADELLAPQSGTLLQVYDSGLVGFAAKGLDDAKALAIGKDPRVTSIGQDCVVTVADSQANAPWNLDRIDTKALTLDTKYDYQLNGEGVHVYVVDSGIRATHMEFGGRVSGGVDLVNDGKGTDDCNGHGTHVAGVIGGTTYGVAKGVSLHPVRVAGCDGKSAASTLMAAASWIQKNRQIPAVVNVSMTSARTAQLNFAYTQIWNNAATITVAAAGNDGKPTNLYSPASDSAVISVGATDMTDTRWSMSNTDPKIFAPGVEIVSADIASDTATATKTGTSAAAAHVTGVIARDLMFRRTKHPAQIAPRLTANAVTGAVKNPGGTTKDLVYGGYTDVPLGFAMTTIAFKDQNGNGLFSDASGVLAKPALWAGINYQYYPQTGRDTPCFLALEAAGFGKGNCLGNGNVFLFPQAWLDVDNIWQTARFMDVDGKPDIGPDFCLRSPTGIQCARAVGAGGWNLSQWDTAFGDNSGWAANPNLWATIQFADINGDGKTDVCGRANGGIYCGTSTGMAFNAPTLWTDSFSDGAGWGGLPSLWGTIRFIDLNGDRKADICGRSSAGIACGLSNGTSFQAVGLWDDYYTDAGPWDDDPAYWATIQYADIDGDGKQDVCGRAQNGIVCRRSTGTAFGPVELWTIDFGDNGGWAGNQNLWGTIQFPDINADGRADVCGRSNSGVVCALSTGTRFVLTQMWSPTFSDVAGWSAQPYYWGTIRYADLNGDGTKDICGRSGDGIVCGAAPVP